MPILIDPFMRRVKEREKQKLEKKGKRMTRKRMRYFCCIERERERERLTGVRVGWKRGQRRRGR